MKVVDISALLLMRLRLLVVIAPNSILFYNQSVLRVCRAQVHTIYSKAETDPLLLLLSDVQQSPIEYCISFTWPQWCLPCKLDCWFACSGFHANMITALLPWIVLYCIALVSDKSLLVFYTLCLSTLYLLLKALRWTPIQKLLLKKMILSYTSVFEVMYWNKFIRNCSPVILF